MPLCNPSPPDIVVATRRFPSCSESEYWLSRLPSTPPEATCFGLPAPDTSNW